MNMFSVNNELLLQVKKIPLKFLRTAIGLPKTNLLVYRTYGRKPKSK